jgi:hypothetical protein
MSGGGKGGSNRKNKHFSKHANQKKHQTVSSPETFFTEGKIEKNRISLQDRPQWTAPELPDNPITTPDCPWCGKQITDITTAISDKDSGLPVHFDCVLARISEAEKLEANDTVCYIGGGRFGIVHYNNPPDMRDFTIKKILEWEAKENVKDWRRPISEYFSIT